MGSEAKASVVLLGSAGPRRQHPDNLGVPANWGVTNQHAGHPGPARASSGCASMSLWSDQVTGLHR